MAIDYAALLDRIMPDDSFDPETLQRFESDREEIRSALKERKLPTSDETVTELHDAVMARLRFLGV